VEELLETEKKKFTPLLYRSDFRFLLRKSFFVYREMFWFAVLLNGYHRLMISDQLRNQTLKRELESELGGCHLLGGH
jgi:hypothetical protein